MAKRKEKTIWELGIFALIAWMFSSIFTSSSRASPGKTKGENSIWEVLRSKGYSDQVIRNWIAISKMETGNFSSRLYKEDHNLFGMKRPQTRQTTAVNPKTDTWAAYVDDKGSAEDIVLYMEARMYPKDFPGYQAESSLDQQIRFMKEKGYFEEPYLQYLNLVKQWT